MQKSLPVAEKLKKHPFVPLLVHSIGKEAFFVKKLYASTTYGTPPD
jgi:hypothetical protein